MTNENPTAHPLDRRDDPRLTAYVLGELSSEERAAFERELATDAELAAEVRAIEGLAGELRGSLAPTATTTLDDSRRDTILAALRPAPSPAARSPWRLHRLVAIAAAVFALVGIGAWLRRTAPGRAEGPFVYRIFGWGEEVAALPDGRNPAEEAGRSPASAPATPETIYLGRAGATAGPSKIHLEGFGGGARNPEYDRNRTTFTFGTASGAFASLSMDVRETTPVEPNEGESTTLDAETRESLRALGYSGDGESQQALEALGYGGGEQFSAGVEGPYSLTRDGSQPSATYTWRDTSVGPGLRNLLVPESPGTEVYDSIAEAPFRDPTREPLSTFSIDVDTASYANVRRFLSERQLPPPDAVRIEELVNYFRYEYPEPRGKVPFSVTVDSASVPWKPEHRLVRIGLRGRAPADERPKAKNLVFLVDVSGSMNAPDKLPLVQRSLRLLVDELSPDDRVALVVYAGNSGVVLPSTSVDSRAVIHAAIDGLTSGGSTNGGSGIQLAYEMAQRHFAKDGVNRVILATDGDFNVGITDRAALLALIEEKRRSGVFLSVLGFGTGNLKDGTMEQLADHGNGNYGYIDSLAEARKLLVREMDSTLETIAKDVKIQVEFNPAKVAAYRLVGYENRVLAARDFNDDRKDAGEIGAGHTVTALYEIVPVGVALAASVDPLRYQPTAQNQPGAGRDQSGAARDVAARPADASSEFLTVKLRYKEPSSDTSELLTVPFTDEGRSFAEAAPDLRFAASVAAFGLTLRRSPALAATSLRDVYRWAEPAIGNDPHGDRREFLKLVDQAAGLAGR